MVDDGREGPMDKLLRASSLDESPSPHLDDEQLAAVAEARTLDDADPGLVEHLSRCDRCRRDWIELRRGAGQLVTVGALEETPWESERAAQGRAPEDALPRTTPTWAGRLLRAPGLAAVVLILAGVALIVPWERFGDPGPLRSEDTALALDPLAPIGELKAGEPVVFRWHEAPGASAYEIVVADEATAETVLRVRTAAAFHEATAAELEQLEPGRDYRWLVRAERGIGRVSTGTPAHFRLPTP